MATVLHPGQIWSRELSKWSGKKGGNAASLYVRLVIASEREGMLRSRKGDWDGEHIAVYKKTEDVGRVGEWACGFHGCSGEVYVLGCVGMRLWLQVCVSVAKTRPAVWARAMKACSSFCQRYEAPYRLWPPLIKVRSKFYGRRKISIVGCRSVSGLHGVWLCLVCWQLNRVVDVLCSHVQTTYYYTISKEAR